MRLRAKVDDNQKEIVAAARKLGFSVFVTSQLGKGFPDLVLGLAGVNYLVEVKDGNKPLSQRRLTIDEQDFKTAWRGSYDIIESTEDLIRLYNANPLVKKTLAACKQRRNYRKSRITVNN